MKVSLSLLSWRKYCLCKSDKTYHVKWNTSLIILNTILSVIYPFHCKGRNMIKLRYDRLNIMCQDRKRYFLSK